MSFLNSVKRWFGMTENPPATSGDTSVLFCLRNKSPMTLDELNRETHIPFSELRKLLERLVYSSRITEESGFGADAAKKYRIVEKPASDYHSTPGDEQ